MKKLFLAAIFGFAINSCGTKESSASTSNTDSTAVDSASMMAPSTTDTTMRAAPTDTASMKMDSATVR
ncbi:cytochrome C551 [Chryseobacterium sp.]|uniref:cytochrome C551 n=1 Tax=Chryseobacterium sp. TaxID=1871047 RepID=UPI0028993784|nr:cytochrome C551 [Chryseobacterium sp.]